MDMWVTQKTELTMHYTFQTGKDPNPTESEPPEARKREVGGEKVETRTPPPHPVWLIVGVQQMFSKAGSTSRLELFQDGSLNASSINNLEQ